MRRLLLLGSLLIALVPSSGAIGEVYNPDNGHYYQYIDCSADSVTWLSANAAAQGMTCHGFHGYLATITSERENTFLVDNLPDTPEVTSYWVGGFQITASSDAKAGWFWVTGEPWKYTNWSEGEPNDSAGTKEDGLEWRSHSGDYGKWNDFLRSDSGKEPGYIVEFGPAINPATGNPHAPDQAEVRITADNIYWAWMNPGVLKGDGKADPSYLGSNAAGKADVDNWSTPESYFVRLRPGANSLVVKAMNVVGETPYGTHNGPSVENPAGLLASVLFQDETIKVTDATWQYSLEENPTVDGDWQDMPVAIAPWDGGTIWNGKDLPGLLNAFKDSGAKWIWSETYPCQPNGQSITVWFRTTVTMPAAKPILDLK